MAETTKNGKINAQNFKDLVLNACGSRREEVVSSPQFGVDTAVIDLDNERALAVSSDPLTLIPSLGLKESAWLSVHLLVNDMATTGFAPQYAQFVLNLPVSFNDEDFKIYWNYIHQFCEEVGIAITGGHTGRVPGQESTICGGGTMFLQAPKAKILSSNLAQPGDAIVVTKKSALSATSILAKSFPETIKRALGQDLYEHATANFYETYSLKEALLATECLEAHRSLKAMHDVTEGGILGGLSEMAQASNCGFLVENDKIPVGEAQQKIAALFDIDHRYCIGSGAMLMAVAPEAVEKLTAYLDKNGIKASVLGRFTPEKDGFQLKENNQITSITYDGHDPYWDAFYKAYKEGLK